MLSGRLSSIEMFWRAANYLTVGMLYLRSNPLLREELACRHFKRTIHGHWGACPAISAIWAHVSDLSRRRGRRMRLIVGAGHAGPAFLACLYLEGTLEQFYPRFTRDVPGLTSLFNSFASEDGFSTEITPDYPGAIYCGGELGSALAFSQGYVLRSPEKFCVCVIGDGEMETSITQGTWQGFRFLSGQSDGRVLPIINANGYKMGSRSIFAMRSPQERVRFLEGHGLLPICVGANHDEIAAALDHAYAELDVPTPSRQPVIVLETPKGWTGPERFGNTPFAGSVSSHKPILKNPAIDQDELKMIHKWLLSYRPDELFDTSGAPNAEIGACLPPEDRVLGLTHEVVCRPSAGGPAPICEDTQPIKVLTGRLIGKMRNDADFLVLSPDELSSNRLAELLEFTQLKYGVAYDPGYSGLGQVIEILNEHLCYAWAQGFSAAGHRAVFVCYEAFAPVLDSMLAQHLKFLRGCAHAQWRPEMPGVNIILTSLGWHNTPTHHNPGCIDSFIGRRLPNMSVYMPVTGAAVSRFVDEMFESVNRVNVMVMSKHHMPQLSALSADIDAQAQTSWRYLAHDGTRAAAISLIAAGDCMAEEVLSAKDLINKWCPGVSVQVIAVERLNCLEDSEDPARASLISTLLDSAVRVFAYNGYPTTIQGVLWDTGLNTNTTVLGYRDEDCTPTGMTRFIANRVSRFDIAKEALRLAHALPEKFGALMTNKDGADKEPNQWSE